MVATYITRAELPDAAARELARRRIQAEGLTYQRTPEDQALWEACRWDLGLFGKTFVPHWCTEAYNPLQLDYYATYRARQGSRGHYDVTAAPRAHSKSTGCCLVSMLHSAAYQTERYTVYLTNRDGDAANKMSDLRRQLERNALLLRVEKDT